jgi:CHAD domain-containing protein
MVFRIDVACSTNTEIQRVFAEQISLGLRCLGEVEGEAAEEGIHELRKTTKRLRAIVRLIASVLPRRTRRQWVAGLQQVARALASDRDSTVLEQSLEKVYRAAFPDTEPSSRPYQAFLPKPEACADARITPDAVTLEEAKGMLHALGQQMADTLLLGVDAPELVGGIVRSYRRGRRLLRKYERTPSVSGLHELRKRVKDQLYQLRLLVELSPTSLRAQAVEFDWLAELLGDHHDLANLDAKLACGGTGEPEEPLRAALREGIRVQQRALEEEALGVAHCLYAESWRSRRRRFLALHAVLCRTPGGSSPVDPSPVTE